MFRLDSLQARCSIVALLLLPLAACDKVGSLMPASGADPQETSAPAAPSVFGKTLDIAAYGTATISNEGNRARVKLASGGEGGISMTLNPSVGEKSVVTFSISAPSPMNFRVTGADGEIAYLSTEGRGHVVLGPGAAAEALVYAADAGDFDLEVKSIEPCGGELVCAADGSVSIRLGEPGAPTTLIATSYGAAGLSHPDASAIAATRGGPSGEYGFTLARDVEGESSLLVEFGSEASELINIVVQNGETKDYVSSQTGWIRLDPGATATAYTPGTGTFKFLNFKVSNCTPEEPRCVPATSPQ